MVVTTIHLEEDQMIISMILISEHKEVLPEDPQITHPSQDHHQIDDLLQVIFLIDCVCFVYNHNKLYMYC